MVSWGDILFLFFSQRITVFTVGCNLWVSHWLASQTTAADHWKFKKCTDNKNPFAFSNWCYEDNAGWGELE